MTTRDSYAILGERRLRYTELADEAAALPVPDPETVTLKPFEDFRLLGRRVTGVDNAALVRGQPLFGIDQDVPGMKFAVYEKCDATGGRVKSANLDEVRQLPGVVDAFVLRDSKEPE